MLKIEKIKWNDELIEKEILKIVNHLEINRMPTSTEIHNVRKNYGLNVAIERHGGYKYWADKLNLNQSKCETRLGLIGELRAKEILESKGYEVEKMSVKHPYDLLVNKNIKIDSKISKLFKSDYGSYYTFNLEKKNPTCDIYIAFCVDDSINIIKTYVIPSKFLHKTQLSIGEHTSKYDRFLDRWDYIEQFNKFYEQIS